jgi:hypothetical protein
MKNIYGFSLLLFLIPLVGHSQINPDWVATYDGLGTSRSFDKSHAIAVDLSGNIYVTGESYGASDNLDYLTVKIDPAGNTLWTRRYNGSGDSSDVATDIAVDVLGNVFVTGSSMGDTTNLDYVTIKYNTIGDLEWIAKYNGPNVLGVAPGIDGANSIFVDDLGYSYVTGYSRITYNNNDILTVKYDPAGDVVWVNRYNGPLSVADQAYKVKVDDLGNVYVVGFVDGGGGLGARDYCTIKYNSSGTQEWLARYNGPDNRDDEARLVGVDDLGNVYVTGISQSLTTYFDYLTIKYNSAGIEQWTVRYSYSSLAKEDTPRDMVVDAAGNCYITGMARSDQNWAGFSTVKYNSSGVELWTNRYDPYHTEDPYGIALDNLGNVYVSGESNSSVFTIAYNSLGSEIWSTTFENPGLSQEFVSDIVVDTFTTASPKLYISGSTVKQAQNSDYQIIKYSSITAVEDQNNIPISFNLAQNYPNPFNPSTKINYSIAQFSQVALKIYDVLGTEVATLVNEEKPAGSYEVNFNASQLSSGIYFYKLQAGSFIQTRKMILIK